MNAPRGRIARTRALRLSALSALTALTALTALLAGAGCSTKSDDGTSPISLITELPRVELRDDTPNLLLTWIDDKGETHVTMKPADVPAEGKKLVRVILSDREDGTRDMFYVADLTQKAEADTYVVKTMPRREWEALLEKRRAAQIAALAPPPPPPVAPSPSGGAAPGAGPTAQGVSVIVYGASWCKPCHDAEAYLRRKGVAVIMKDIEENPAAAAEMREKLARVNQRGGSIPVLDVRGQILVGFSPGAVDRALSRAAGGTAL
ncbi:glutaredoxin family protein [Chondromyces apiculatus]|uniref:Glutaredoxin domain-containing protein n=1 Tax=Chondromyces apiculatus DSM 436 TaxID=1192034 RepID=A0A017SSP0_9BACT|nr:glutaredoxin domain-containing protein [Chondromyces apiculatus]EYE99997.1 Hypothetical protein CAP_1849 [Chondromyces apiculatus DSM 436]